MRLLSLGLALLLCGAYPSVVSRALDSTVILYADYYDDNGDFQAGRAICSGFVVESDRSSEVIATAAHCTDDVSEREVRFFDGDVGRIEGVWKSNVADAAVLVVKTMRRHPAVRFAANVNPGDPLFIVGMPSGDPWSFTSAFSRNGSQIQKIDNEPFLTIESPAAWHGDSGAAVFDKRGRVIGLVVAGGDSNYPAVTYCTPAHYIRVLF